MHIRPASAFLTSVRGGPTLCIMSDYRQRINNLEKESRINETMIQQDLEFLGDYVFSKDGMSLEGEHIEQSLAQVQSLRGEIEQASDQVDRIKSLLDRQSAIKESEAELKKREKQAGADLGPVYEQIGETAFTIYKNNPFVDQEYVEIFSQLAKNQEDMRDAQRDAEQVEQELAQKSFLERMVLKGRLVLLKNRISSKESSFPRLYRKAGEEIAGSGFIESINDPNLTSVAQPYDEYRRKLEDLESELAQLEKELQLNQKELSELCEGSRPQKQINEVLKTIEEKDAARAGHYRELGKAFMDTKPTQKDQPKEVAERIKSINALQKENDAHAREIERLQAAMKVDQLESDIERMQASIRSHKKEIENYQTRIEELSSQIDDAEKEKAEAEKTRGELESL